MIELHITNERQVAGKPGLVLAEVRPTKTNLLRMIDRHRETVWPIVLVCTALAFSAYCWIAY